MIRNIIKAIRGLFSRNAAPVAKPSTYNPVQPGEVIAPMFYCITGQHNSPEWLGKPVSAVIDGQRVTLPGLWQCIDCWTARKELTEDEARAYLATIPLSTACNRGECGDCIAPCDHKCHFETEADYLAAYLAASNA